MTDCRASRGEIQPVSCYSNYGCKSEPCLAAGRAKAKASYRSNPNANRNIMLRNLYGLTLAEYDSMVVAQCGVCAICGRFDIRGSRLGVDHDHATDQVRGLLCSPCNTGLGYFQESPEILHNAASYLKETT